MGKTSIAIVAAALAASGAVFLAYSVDISRARAALERGSQAANTSAGLIEYAEKGAGPPLLSIHGAGGGYDQGLLVATAFVGDGFHVIAPSRFGYLGTPIPEDSSPAAQADAHAALLANRGVERTVVLGVSAGARSAVELALRHSESVAALILVVPGTYAPTSPVAVEGSRGSQIVFWVVNAGADFAWWAMEKVAPSVLIRFMGVPPKVVSAASREERSRVMGLVRSIEPLSRRFPGINIDSAADLHRLPLEAISVPTLVISARDDLFNTLPAAEHAAGLIPNAKLVVFKTGGHLLVGREEEARAVTREFLANALLNASWTFEAEAHL